jgi:hypothetical protein
MATPSLAMIPSAYADSKVYSVLPNNGDGDFTFDRASTATRIGQNGLIQTVATDIPRLNYDISNGVVQSCPSLLLEPASTNLVTYSEDFSQSTWSKLGSGTGTTAVVTSNYAISPDGTLNASRIVLDKGSGTASGDFSAIADGILLTGEGTFSIYLKSNTGANYVVSQRIEDDRQQITVTKEWQRFTFSSSSLVNGTSGLWLRGGYGSDDYADLLVYGAQTENLSYATSYIPTNGASQTRAAETCFGAGTASTFNSTEGVLYAEIAGLSNPVDSPKNITISDGTVSKYVRIEYYQDGKVYGNVYDGASVAASFVVNQTNFNKIAIQYSSSGSKLYVNGTGVNFASKIFASNTLNTIQFSSAAANSNYFYGKVKDIRVYNEALTDLQLQNLTTL